MSWAQVEAALQLDPATWVGINAPGVGALSGAEAVGARCFPGQDAAFKRELATSIGRIEGSYARTSGATNGSRTALAEGLCRRRD